MKSPVLLASSSPRRKLLLESAGFSCVSFDPGVDESRRDLLPLPRRVVALARDKLEKTLGIDPPVHPECRVAVSADTMIGMDGKGLGKPRDRHDAKAMIEMMAGRAHVVATGQAMASRERLTRVCTRLSLSSVRFRPLSEGEIERYLESDEWMDVAGAYRIQGRAALFVTELQGSWSGIMGLSLSDFYDMLAELGATEAVG